MKREIKFRGKDLDSCEWIYGSLCKFANNSAMIAKFEPNDSGEVCDVSTETIGQFTGLYDKNSKEIYEGDIVHRDKDNRKYVVKFWQGMFYASVKEFNECIYGGFPLWSMCGNEEGYQCEVIGDIYEYSLIKDK